MFDVPVMILLGVAALGVISKNQTVAIAMLILALLRLTNMHKTFPFLEKHGLTIGIVILTVGVMTPIASGRISPQDIIKSFTHWQSLLAIIVGILVAFLGGRGVSLMSAQPQIVTGLLIGTVIGVAVFRGVPVGPLIAAGILSMLIGKGQ